jgi:hypothetical protein
MDGQRSEQKCADGAKIAEICMVSQQSETKTVVVEVHRSQEVDDSVAIPKSSLVSERLTADEVRDKVNHSCHGAVILTQYLPKFICYGMIIIRN